MLRLLVLGNIRRSSHEFGRSLQASYSEVRNGSFVTVGLPFSIYRMYSRGHALFTFNKVKIKENIYNCSKNFYVNSTSKQMTHHTQLACKRLFQICSYRSPALPPICRFVRAVTLSLTRSNLVAPIFGVIIGDLARRQTTLADAGLFPRTSTLYMHAQDGHVYLTSFIFSVFEGFILFLRAIYLAFLFTPAIALAPFSDSFGVEFRKAWLHLIHVTLEKAGPAFIKWGQWAATRPDLFPRDMCSELSKLHSKAPTHSFSYTKRTIEKAFNRKLSEVFEDFEEEPVASGSIAQVHRATLRFWYSSQQVKPIVVAVKVRHPGVGEAIRRDFVIINLIAKISKIMPTLKWLRLDESVQQFGVFMMSQVDLAREAAHLSRFIYNFRSSKDVSFPKPLYPFVHPAVLVETYEKGENVLHFVDGLQGNDHIKSALAHLGTHTLLKMLLEDNFIHADMHPGNILVRISQSKTPRRRLFKSKPHVILLDVGMTAELCKGDQVNLLNFFKAVALRDGRTAAECTLRFSKQQDCPNPVAFIEEVEKSFTFWDTVEGELVHPADCMQQLLEKVRRHKVNIDGNVCSVMVTTLVLEGWQRKLDPDYDVMETLKTLLFKADLAQSLSYTINGLMAP
ncbi:Abc1 family protein [Thalictrum thalictroides]|uniref:Abc1 family protein n=1 Tax=Thalictrum thalictroides TaxID=46969 RepID=A0A7J6X7R2_THATH|nr:Abc1 family protein [Thalictrum thalictroides]